MYWINAPMLLFVVPIKQLQGKWRTGRRVGTWSLFTDVWSQYQQHLYPSH
jgi:hypothetical protein